MSYKIPEYKSPNRRRLEREITQLERKLYLLRSRLKEADEAPGLDLILKQVSLHGGVQPEMLMSRNRDRDVADLRSIFISISVNVYRHAKAEVASFLGVHHATVHYHLTQYPVKMVHQPFRELSSTLHHNVRTCISRPATSRPTILQ